MTRPAGAPLLARSARARHPPAVLWRFARAHTVLGTWSAILALYAIAVAELDVAPGDGLAQLAWVAFAGFCVNVAIVGVNQIEDVEVDRINKPYLPIAAGDLSPRAARAIVAGATAVALALAVSQGLAETLAVGGALAIGFAYSLPPLRLRRRPVVAALSIALVRSLAVNLGVYLHFSAALAGERGLGAVPAPIWALTLFVAAFGLAIALLKDVPDIDGDRRFAVATFSVRLGPGPVLRIALGLLALAYAGMAIGGPLLVDGANPVVLAAGHVAAFALLARRAARVDLGDRNDVTRFYMTVWTLFFSEYALVALACAIG